MGEAPELGHELSMVWGSPGPHPPKLTVPSPPAPASDSLETWCQPTEEGLEGKQSHRLQNWGSGAAACLGCLGAELMHLIRSHRAHVTHQARPLAAASGDPVADPAGGNSVN